MMLVVGTVYTGCTVYLFTGDGRDVRETHGDARRVRGQGHGLHAQYGGHGEIYRNTHTLWIQCV